MFQSFLEYTKNTAINKKLIDQYGNIKVYVVDGKAVRDSSKQSQEFGLSSTHANLPNTVPKNEIWIENNVKAEERPVLIASALYQIRMIKNGMSLGKAYDLQIKKEKDYRESVLLSKKHPSETDEKADKSVYLKKYGHIKNEDIEVWLVSGEKVRNFFKSDFLEGGHGYVYNWVPNKEIWIEFGMHESENPYVVLHEYFERIIMKYRKISYDKAHEIAAKIEWKMRERGGFNKEDALSLTKSKALELAKDYLK